MNITEFDVRTTNAIRLATTYTPGTTVFETDTGDGFIKTDAGWEQTHSDGQQMVRLASQANLDSSSASDHIAAGTTATGSVEAGNWVNRAGYDRGVIEIAVVDGGPVGDLTGEFQIAYSLDEGATFSEYETLVAIANIGANDSQTLIVDLADIKNAPYFKVKEVLASATSLAAVTFGVKVFLERLRG